MEEEQQPDIPVPETQPETPEPGAPAPEGESVEILKARLEKEAEARRKLTARATKAEADAKALEARLAETGSGTPGLDVENYIDISAALEGLDEREKSRLVKEHKLSGKSLREIRDDEDFKLWQSAHRAKVEKERLAMKPSGTQAEEDRPSTLTQRLAAAPRNDWKAEMEAKEKELRAAGLYKEVRPRQDRRVIGG